MIPLVDLNAQHDPIKEELYSAIRSVISKSQFIGGDELKNFEENFASYLGAKYCIGTSSGSTALYTALKALGIGRDDEVILPVNTFIATATAVRMAEARPVFSDVNSSDFLLDPDTLEEKITPKTKAIIPVHLHGAVCDMDKILDISKKHYLSIIEDCAQAHGASYKGNKVPISDVGCFSFFPAKNLGAFGDAGCIVTSDKDFAEKCRMFVNHGRTDKYIHSAEGFNFRFDNLQAAILNVKLKFLNNWTDKKRKMAFTYDKGLEGIVGKQSVHPDVGHAYHLYVVRSKNRDELQKVLKENGIETGIHYPVPLHLQPTFSHLNYKKGDFPIAEKLSKEIISIPIYPELSSEQQNKIIEKINSFHDTN